MFFHWRFHPTSLLLARQINQSNILFYECETFYRHRPTINPNIHLCQSVMMAMRMMQNVMLLAVLFRPCMEWNAIHEHRRDIETETDLPWLFLSCNAMNCYMDKTVESRYTLNMSTSVLLGYNLHQMNQDSGLWMAPNGQLSLQPQCTRLCLWSPILLQHHWKVVFLFYNALFWHLDPGPTA